MEYIKTQRSLVSKFEPYIEENLRNVDIFVDDITYKFINNSNDRDVFHMMLVKYRKLRPSLRNFPKPLDHDVAKILDIDTWSTSMRDRLESSNPRQILALYTNILDAQIEDHRKEQAMKRKEAKLRRKQRAAEEKAEAGQASVSTQDPMPTDLSSSEAVSATTTTTTTSTNEVDYDSENRKESELLPFPESTSPTPVSDAIAEATLEADDEGETSPPPLEETDVPHTAEASTSEFDIDLKTSLTELWQYQKQVTEQQLTPKVADAGVAAPHAPQLSSISRELLTLLTEKSQDNVTLKHLRRFTPVVQLFDELGIRRSVKNNKIVSPRSAREAFVLHMIHKEHNPHTLVNDLRKHLNAMAPRWREYVYP